MKLHLNVMQKQETINSILMFQVDKASMFWRKQLFDVYPFLDKKKLLNSSWKNRKKYLTKVLNKYYDSIEEDLAKKVRDFNTYWLEKEQEITNNFIQIFGNDCEKSLNNLSAEVSLNPICPRGLAQHYFTIFYRSSTTRFLETVLHETIHFAWFNIWQKHFNDDSKDYEGPHLKWILSEMVVDTFVNNSDIGDFFPEKHHAVYSYFYRMKIENKPIFETLDDLYKKANTLPQFMETAYNYCQKHEQNIRKQML